MFLILQQNRNVVIYILHCNWKMIFCLQLMASHEQELEDLAERLDADRDRQYLNLRDKLAQKRKRKMEELRRKQDVDLTKEMIEQKKEMDEIRMKQVRILL